MPRRTTQSPGESVPVGAAEIAARLGVRPQTVHTWRHRKLMPEPRWTVSGQPAWDWPEIEAWARRTGRLREGDATRRSSSSRESAGRATSTSYGATARPGGDARRHVGLDRAAPCHR